MLAYDSRKGLSTQMLEYLDSYFVTNVKSFDPMVKETLVPNQYYDFDAFLNDIKLIVVLIAHDHIIENQDKLSGKVVYDTRNRLELETAIKL